MCRKAATHGLPPYAAGDGIWNREDERIRYLAGQICRVQGAPPNGTQPYSR